jgi:hypothetical protein
MTMRQHLESQQQQHLQREQASVLNLKSPQQQQHLQRR